MIADRLHRLQLIIASLMCLTVSAIAEATEPRVNIVIPRGGQRATSVEVTIRGQRLHDALEVVMLQPGITIDELTVHDQSRATASFHIADDCPTGPHALRIRAATGISNLMTFNVGDLPEVAEAEPNNALDAPQTVPFSCVVNGVATNEDVDYYAFDVKAGTRITAEIEGLRLGGRVFDPAILLFDPEGFEIAACDDAPLARQDAIVSVIAPTDGTFTIAVRESAYRGNNNCRYRLHIGAYVRPLATIPSGGRPGETLDVNILGNPTGPRTARMTLPDEGVASRGWCPPQTVGVTIPDDAGAPPSPNWFRITDLNNAIETEPNNGQNDATPITIPCAAHGVIEEPGDRDIFVFNAAKGQAWNVDVYSRRLRSPLDAVINIRKKGGGNIAGNDDDRGTPDSRVRFTAPEDGEYILIVRDHLNSGGPTHAYRVEFTQVQPSLSVQAPRQVQQVAVPRGQRAAIMLSALREDFGGDLTCIARNLPAQITMTAPLIDASIGTVPVVFEATADAPLTATLLDIEARHTKSADPIVGTYSQDIEMSLGRNNTVFWAHTVDRLPVAVVEPVPYTIEVAEPKAPLVRNGTMLLNVRITRAEGFTQPVRLNVPFTPPGVGAQRGVVIQPDKTEATITLNANGNAPLKQWQIIVEANANAQGGGQHAICSSLLALEVAEPYLTFAPQGTNVERGQATTMGITVSRRVDQPGDVSVELRGLPHNVATMPVNLSPTDDAITFEVSTKPDSPVGRHRNVFCIARYDVNGEQVIHRLPAGELRIDKPLPKETAPASAAPPPPPKPEANGERPLTRLEKLRLEHEQRRAQLKAQKQKQQQEENNEGDDSDAANAANKEGDDQ